MDKQFLNPPNISKPTGYTHVVAAQGSRLIFIAGQVALDAQGQLVGAGDFAAQAKQVYENLSRALAAVGASFEDVVKLNTYSVNYSPELRPILAEVRRQYVNMDRPPASTLVGVQALAAPEFLIEIEAVAVVDGMYGTL